MKSLSRTNIAFFALTMLICSSTFAQPRKLCVTVVERGYTKNWLGAQTKTNWFHVHCGRGNTWDQALANAKKKIHYDAQAGWAYLDRNVENSLSTDGGKRTGLSETIAIKECTIGFKDLKEAHDWATDPPAAFYNRCYD